MISSLLILAMLAGSPSDRLEAIREYNDARSPGHAMGAGRALQATGALMLVGATVIGAWDDEQRTLDAGQVVMWKAASVGIMALGHLVGGSFPE